MLYACWCLADTIDHGLDQSCYIRSLYRIRFQSLASQLAHHLKMDDTVPSLQGLEWPRDSHDLLYVPMESRKHRSILEYDFVRSSPNTAKYLISDLFQLPVLLHWPWLERDYLGHVSI